MAEEAPSRSPGAALPFPATSAALVVAAVWLTHTTLIDRLEVTKLAVALVATAGAALAGVLVGARAGSASGEAAKNGTAGLPLAGGLGLCLLASSLLFGDFVAARVESWAPLVAAGLVFALARRPAAAGATALVALVAGALAGLGLAQALGLDWPSGEVAAFRGRPVMGTLGNPDLFGICLAGALPFALARARRTGLAIAAALVVAAIVVSGSRTAWVMAVPGLIVGWRRLPVRRLAAVGAAGLALASLVALTGQRVGLGGRLADLGDSGGTAAGRLYLWRVDLELLVDAGPLGGGPGAFQRRWPAAQGDYLAAHPQAADFYSDLRHAHADPIEIAVDWGWLGLLGFGWGALRLLRRRDGGERTGAEAAAQAAARASLVALLVGGLAFPVLFQTPSLLLAAFAAGQLAGTPRRVTLRGVWAWRAAVAAGVLAALFWVGRRTASEVARNNGLRAEVAGQLDEARERYARAVALDPENPLAQLMVARSQLDVAPARALEATERAAEELPIPAVYALRAVAAGAAGEPSRAAESWRMVDALRPGWRRSDALE